MGNYFLELTSLFTQKGQSNRRKLGVAIPQLLCTEEVSMSTIVSLLREVPASGVKECRGEKSSTAYSNTASGSFYSLVCLQKLRHGWGKICFCQVGSPRTGDLCLHFKCAGARMRLEHQESFQLCLPSAQHSGCTWGLAGHVLDTTALILI